MAALTTVVSIVEIIVLVLAFATGIAVATLVGTSKNDFQGDCVLYSGVEWTSHTFFQIRPASGGKCAYAIGAQSIALITAFIYAAYRAAVLVTNRFDVALLRVISVPVYAMFAFLILVQACLVTMGLLNLCRGLQSEPAFANADCRLFQDFTWVHRDGSRFYDTLKMAEVASWISFVSWCLLVALVVVYFAFERKYAKMEPVLDKQKPAKI